MKDRLTIDSDILLKLTVTLLLISALYVSLSQVAVSADVNVAIAPLQITQTTTILASDPAEGDKFSDAAIAMSGDTAVIGAKRKSGDSGAAYIYTRNEDGADQWGEVMKLTPAITGTRFGNAVAIDDDTLVVGAVWDGTKGDKAGAAYIFERNLGGLNNWGFVKKLVPNQLVAEDRFGFKVAVDGDIIAVSAYRDDDNFQDSGSVYLFKRNLNGANQWGELTKLHADDPNPQDEFGRDLAISGDTIVIGTNRANDDLDSKDPGTAYIFERNEDGVDNWGLVKRLSSVNGAMEDRFGFPLAIENDFIAVGAQFDGTAGTEAGKVYLYERNTGGANNWGEVKTFTPQSPTLLTDFGRSVDIDGGILIIGDTGDDEGRGIIHVYERNTGGADNWGAVTSLSADDGLADDFLGFPVAIDSNTIIAGAHGNDSAADDAGAAYVFSLSGNVWAPLVEQTAIDIMPDDRFSENAVAISGDTAIVGAQRKSASIGAAYIFTRNQNGADTWSQTVKLLPDLVQPGLRFGNAVAISGDTAIVGALWASNDVPKGGAAYVFERNQGGPDAWGLVTKLQPSILSDDDQFGVSVAIDRDTIVVGAFQDDTEAENAGIAYVFERNQGGGNQWGPVARLRNPNQTTDDEMGISVAISGDTIIAGTRREDDGDGQETGIAFIFRRNQGGADKWWPVRNLQSVKPSAEDGFGFPVAIEDNIIVVGARLDDGLVSDTGTVHIFERNQLGADQWGLRKIISASDGSTNDLFGRSLAINNQMAIIGASGDDDSRGAAYTFARNTGGADQWAQTAKIVAATTDSQDYFGIATGLSDNHAIIGSPRHDLTASSVVLSDEALSDEGTFHIYALTYIENQLPTVLDDAYDVFRNSIDNSFTVLDNDSDPDTDNLTILSVGSLDQGGDATTDGQTITYTPAPGFTGEEMLTYIVSDTKFGQATGNIKVNVLNRAPDAPNNPSPSDTAADVSSDTNLLWEGSDPDSDTLTYDVYFGTTNPPSMVASGIDVTSYNPDTLLDGTAYFWQIVANDGIDTSTSPIWSFATAEEKIPNQPPNQPDNQFPETGSFDLPTDVITLTWNGSDPNGDALIYTVNFGTQDPPPEVANNLSTESHIVTDLAEDTQYFWQVSAFDGQATTSGSVWSFTTAPPEIYIAYLPLLLKSAPTGAFTFENLTDNAVTIDLIDYDVMVFPDTVGPHTWSGIPVATYDWVATGTCSGEEGSVGSIFDTADSKYREPLTILANQTVEINDGQFDCNN